ncbi:hypothetical protein BRARA_F01640 [Brassica rapa]|uniref:Uncharacterized protein n=1 Tax=Brassica campestris TaxID=3711 RepID=A0A397Z2G6_BRACM|nr:hypothetical protein BRARA_F01640 [Brassica rapa]
MGCLGGTQGKCAGHRLMDQALKRSYYIDFKLQRKRKNCRWNGSNLWVRFSPAFVAWKIDVDKFGMYLMKLNLNLNSRFVLELYKCKT